MERLKIERSSLALPKKRKSENSNISWDREQKSKISAVVLEPKSPFRATFFLQGRRAKVEEFGGASVDRIRGPGDRVRRLPEGEGGGKPPRFQRFIEIGNIPSKHAWLPEVTGGYY